MIGAGADRISDVLDLGPIEIDEAAQWWSFYPRHKDKARALAGYARARKLVSAEKILAATKAYAASVEGKPASQISFAVSWLRSEPWRPSPTPVVPLQEARARRGPSKPRRVRKPQQSSIEAQKARWLQRRGLTVEEYELRKGDPEWIEKIKQMPIV